jgi:hypothetical protein
LAAPSGAAGADFLPAGPRPGLALAIADLLP